MINTIELTIEHKDHFTVELTNNKGDTFTYNPHKYEGLEDFLNGAKILSQQSKNTMKKYTITKKEYKEMVEAMNTLTRENQKLRGFIDGMREKLIIGGVEGRSKTFVCGHPPKQTYLYEGTWHCEKCEGKWESIANK